MDASDLDERHFDTALSSDGGESEGEYDTVVLDSFAFQFCVVSVSVSQSFWLMLHVSLFG